MKNIKSYLYISRRFVQIALGVLWLFDGLLQLQHQMFTSAFATQIIAPAAVGQPRIVSGAVHFFVHIFLMHSAVYNTMIAAIQLALGGLILWRRTARLGLLLSVFWGFFVWYIGEGLGGVLSGHTSLLMGAPGAALLYVALALAVVPKNVEQSEDYDSPAVWLTFVWAFLWIGGAIYQLLPGQNSAASIGAMVAGNASGAPGWLASIDMHVANTINSFALPASQGTSYWFILFLAIAQLAIGVGVFSHRLTRMVALSAGIGVSVVFWVIGQSLGGYYSGLATDLNTAPLFILLGVVIMGQPKLDQELLKVYARIEKLFI